MEEYRVFNRPEPLDAVPEDLRQAVRNLGLWRRVKMIESGGEAVADEAAFRRGLDGEGTIDAWMLFLLLVSETLLWAVLPTARRQAFYREHILPVEKYISIETHENGYLPKARRQEVWREAFARAWRFAVIFTPTPARTDALHELEIIWLQAYDRSQAQHEKNYNALSAEVKSVLGYR